MDTDAARWVVIAFLACVVGLAFGHSYWTKEPNVQSRQVRRDIPEQRLATVRIDGREMICVFDPGRYVRVATEWYNDRVEAIDCRWYGRPRLQPWWATRHG